MARHGVSIGAISGGVFPLARSGVLDGYCTSVHWCYGAAFAAEFPRLSTTEDVIKIDRNRMTVSGAAAAFDPRCTWGGCRHRSGLLVSASADARAGVSQRKPTFAAQSTQDMLPAPIQKAVSIFNANISDPINVADVAQQVDVSTRQLERMFRKAIGTTLLPY